MRFFLFSILAIFSVASFAQQMVIYPGEGQSPEQQSKDEGECMIWARDNTGYDPLNPPQAQLVGAPATSQPRQGGAVRGAARGAIIGGIVNGSRGAENGAAIGALGGASRQNQSNQQVAAAQNQQQMEASQQNQQAMADVAAQRENYNTHFKTCMQGRDYTVN